VNRAPGPTLPAAYGAEVRSLQERYAALPADRPVRLAKATSNLFRPRERSTTGSLDMSAFSGLLALDAEAGYADVGGVTTYEELVDALLPSGFMPLVVPELKTITLGGAVTGLGIESSSFRNGMPHESVVEMDVLTGSGEVVTANRDDEHRDLFFGFPNSYGTLGYVLRARIELEAVHPYVHLRHLAFSHLGRLADTLETVCERHEHGGERVDFVDGTVFSPDECYLTLGTWADEAPGASDYTRSEIYYRSIQQRAEDWLTVRDYLWRWDTDWFWCSRAFQAQRPWVRRIAGPRLLRSDVYWKIKAFEDRHRWKARIDSLRGLPDREDVVQDIEVPVGRLVEFVRDLRREVPISPVWLCPIRQRDRSASWDLYRLNPDELYVNVGFWSSVPLEKGMDPHHHNRWVESEVERLGGRKSLYSTSFYDEDRFWELYNGSVYRALKGRYDPEGRLLDLYDKCVRAR
jgi:FAD/FMN-containing dehydrogenase